MKQFFLSAALLVGAALSFTACNNGTYDTDPATNNSGTGNPFNSGNGGSTPGTNGVVNVGANTIQFKANGQLKTIQYGGAAAAGGAVIISGTSGPTFPMESISVSVVDYNGVNTYQDPAGNKVSIQYTKSSSFGSFDFSYGTQVGTANAETIVSLDAGGIIQGTFSGKIWGTKTGSTTVDTVLITDGQFNVPKNEL